MPHHSSRHSPHSSVSNTTAAPEPDYSDLYASLRRKHSKRSPEEYRERLRNTTINANNGAGYTGTTGMGGAWAAPGAATALGNQPEEEKKEGEGEE